MILDNRASINLTYMLHNRPLLLYYYYYYYYYYHYYCYCFTLENKHLKNTCEEVQFWLKEFDEKDAVCAEIVREFFDWPVKHSMKQMHYVIAKMFCIWMCEQCY